MTSSSSSTPLSPRHRGLLHHSSDPFFSPVASDLRCRMSVGGGVSAGFGVADHRNGATNEDGVDAATAASWKSSDRKRRAAPANEEERNETISNAGWHRRNGDANPFFLSVASSASFSFVGADGKTAFRRRAPVSPTAPVSGARALPGGVEWRREEAEATTMSKRRRWQTHPPDSRKTPGVGTIDAKTNSSFRRIDFSDATHPNDASTAAAAAPAAAVPSFFPPKHSASVPPIPSPASTPSTPTNDPPLAPADAPWPTVFNRRLLNLANFPVAQISHRSSFRSQTAALARARRGVVAPGAAESLGVLRRCLQRRIDEEIGAVVAKYVDAYFRPSVENIRENARENAAREDGSREAVTEAHVAAVCREILEESKKMYPSPTPPSPPPTDGAVLKGRRRYSGASALKDAASSASSKARRANAAFDSDSEDSSFKRGVAGPSALGCRKRRPFSAGSGAAAARRRGRRWDPRRLTTESRFVMGAKANRALGLGNTRGRLYSKHPEVFKYSGDQADKQWLFERGFLTATGGKAYLLLTEDVKELAASAEYATAANTRPEDLDDGFQVPEEMLRKMRSTMRAGRGEEEEEETEERGDVAGPTEGSGVEAEKGGGVVVGQSVAGGGVTGVIVDDDEDDFDAGQRLDPASIFSDFGRREDDAADFIAVRNFSRDASPLLFGVGRGVEQIPGFSDVLCGAGLEEEGVGVARNGAGNPDDFLVKTEGVAFLADDDDDAKSRNFSASSLAASSSSSSATPSSSSTSSNLPSASLFGPASIEAMTPPELNLAAPLREGGVAFLVGADC